MAVEFGSDVSTFPDLNVTGVQIKDVRTVVECVLRRWMLPNASLEYDPDAGYDLRDLLNEDLTPSELRRHETRAAMEAEKDERIRSMEVSMTLKEGFRLEVRGTGVLIDDREFNFTAAITQISSEILSVT